MALLGGQWWDAPGGAGPSGGVLVGRDWRPGQVLILRWQWGDECACCAAPPSPAANADGQDTVAAEQVAAARPSASSVHQVPVGNVAIAPPRSQADGAAAAPNPRAGDPDGAPQAGDDPGFGSWPGSWLGGGT